MKRKTKILYILKSSVYSGAENVVLTIMKHLPEDYESMYLATSGEIESVLIEASVAYRLVESFTLKNIKNIISEFKPDIVHSNDFSATAYCAYAKKDFYLVSHLHYDPPWSRKWNIKTMIFALLKNKIDKLLVVSKVSAANYVFYDLYSDKLLVVKNPIDKNKILQMSGKEDNVMSYDIMFCGRFVEQKNPERFIEIIRMLVQDGMKLRCAMLGDGTLYDQCREQIAESGLSEMIELPGFVKNPYSYMQKARILCITSRWEGFGLVAVEANLLGVPVLSTRASGIAEVFGDAAYEYCVTNQDFCDKIKVLLSDHEKYTEIKKLSLKRAEDLADLGGYMKRLINCYEEMVC